MPTYDFGVVNQRLMYKNCKCFLKGDEIQVWSSDEKVFIAKLNWRTRYSLQFNPNNVPMDKKYDEIFKILLDVASSPKKFRLKLAHSNDEEFSYLIFEDGRHEPYFCSRIKNEEEGWKDIFEYEDIEEMPRWVKELYELGALIKEEVQE